MFRSGKRRSLGRVALVLAVVVLLSLAAFQGIQQPTTAGMAGAGPLAAVGSGTGVRRGTIVRAADLPQAVPGAANGVKVGHASHVSVSRPLRELKGRGAAPQVPLEEENRNDKVPLFRHINAADPVVQNSHRGSRVASAPAAVGVNFDGMSVATTGIQVAPPDTNGAVGPTQYVQMVNSAIQVFDKSGNSLAAPAAINQLWSNAPVGDPCAVNNDGDPVVLHDAFTDRWLVTQFTASSPFSECIAISTTGDATGPYVAYSFPLSNTDFADYPKFGIWPDGYYMSVNQFINAQSYGGPQAYVFDRAKMVAGDASATFQTTAGPLGSTVSPLMPADMTGPTPPPPGSPNYFVGPDGTNIDVYKFHVDWTTPANTTFGQSATVAVAPFTELCAGNRECIAQPNTTQRLDGLGDRFMFRLAYRNFGNHEAMVINQSVDASNGSNVAGVRWYEMRDPGGTPTIFQQGTFAPDGNNRWGASVAMDKFGNLALGYSVASASTFPSVRFATRAPGDTLGTLSNETSLVVGTGSQPPASPTRALNRWGDYSAMTLDPTDDCTFWYTQEYYASNAPFDWSTRIASIKMPGCGVVFPPGLKVYTPLVTR